MFTRLFIEPVGGVAGDMLLAALCDLGADRNAIERAFDKIDGVSLSLERVEVNGEEALSVRSIPPRGEPHHRHLDTILALIGAADISSAAQARAERVFGLLAAAEAAVHGATDETVHLHEVGQLDSIMDVVGIAVALDSLGNPAISCAPLPVGSGTVKTAHGLLECPVPAVRAIAERENVPLESVPLEGETVTPTGISVVAEACESFGQMPNGAVACGVGAGTRRFADRANVVRIWGY